LCDNDFELYGVEWWRIRLTFDIFKLLESNIVLKGKLDRRQI